MTTLEDPPAEQDAPPRRRPRLRAVAAVLALPLVVALAMGWHWWTHPRILDSGFGGIVTAPLTSQQFPMYAALGHAYPHRSAESITLHSARALFRQHPPWAHARVYVCSPRPHGGQFMSVESVDGGDTIGDYCAHLRPVRDGTRMRWGGSETTSDYLVVKIPAQPRTATLVGVRVDYARGWSHLRQHGTETIVGEFEVRVKDPSF